MIPLPVYQGTFRIGSENIPVRFEIFGAKDSQRFRCVQTALRAFLQKEVARSPAGSAGARNPQESALSRRISSSRISAFLSGSESRVSLASSDSALLGAAGSTILGLAAEEEREDESKTLQTTCTNNYIRVTFTLRGEERSFGPSDEAFGHILRVHRPEPKEEETLSEWTLIQRDEASGYLESPHIWDSALNDQTTSPPTPSVEEPADLTVAASEWISAMGSLISRAQTALSGFLSQQIKKIFK